MELINHTPYSSLLFRTVLGEDNFAVATMLRVSYNITNGIAVPMKEAIIPLSAKPRMSEFGPLESDMVYRRGGVDLLIFGKAIAPYGRTVTQMEIKIRVKNKLNYKLIVIGNRYWKEDSSGLTKTKPRPFKEMPVSLFNAFGGNSNFDGLEIPFEYNPYGKGYYLKKEDAINKPLPNVENIDFLIQKWNDRPDPIGVVQCPMNSLRMKGNIEYEGTKITKINPRFYNAAFPNMILSNIKSGERVEIEGMNKSGFFDFSIPKHNFIVKLILGEKTYNRNMAIDQLGVFPELNKIFITYRFPFRYVFHPLQKRMCSIYENKSTQDGLQDLY